MKTSFDFVVKQFAQFLNASWDGASTLVNLGEQQRSGELMADWAQANWELLVESHLRGRVRSGSAFLEPYGEGADCNDFGSRVWNPDALPTHRVECAPSDGPLMLDLLTGRSVDAAKSSLVFDHFAAKSDRGWHEQAPPFDCILCYQDDQEVLIRLEQVTFRAVPLTT